MTIVKTDHKLEQANFVFDDAGEVTDVKLTVNYALDEDGIELTRVRREVSVWDSLTAQQKTQAGTIGKRLKILAAAV